jgi:carboxyl-terminal processing protease
METELIRKSAFFNYTRHYFGLHSTALPKSWMPDDVTLNDFHEYLLKQSYNFKESEFTQDRDWIQRGLAIEMYVTAFNKDESDRVMAQTDPEVARAVDAMPRARALLETAKKIIVQRMSGQQAELTRH